MRKVLVIMMFALGCAAYPPRTVPGPPPKGDCSDGIGYTDTGNGALVCVNRDSVTGAITANPQWVEVHSGHDILLMLSDGAGDLDVQFPVKVKLHNYQHGCGTGGGDRARYKATAKTVTVSTGWIKYRVIDRQSEKEEDPEVMIDP